MSNPIENFKIQLASLISTNMRLLLSKKHLYQSTEVDMSQIESGLFRLQTLKSHPDVASELFQMLWEPVTPSTRNIGGVYNDPYEANLVRFDVPHIKIFCPVCDGEEAHNPYGEAGERCFHPLTRLPRVKNYIVIHQ